MTEQQDYSTKQAQWPAPTPLTDELALPGFPSSALPDVLRSWAEAQALALQVPIELPAFQALAAVSACVAKRLDIEVRPGWREPLNTYWLVAMPPAERKSPVVRAAIAPLTLHEQRQREQHQAQLDALAGDDEQRAERERLELAGPPRMIVQDTTPEALARVMAANGGRAALISAEGGIFETIGGRYTNNIPNLDLFLQAHSGDSVRIDRRNGPPIILDEPALTVGLAVQPAVLEGLAGKPGFRGRGLLARFLFALPKSMVGHRAVTPPPVPKAVTEAYGRALAALLALPEPLDEAPALRLSALAHERMVSYQAEIEPRLGAFADLGPIGDWAGKLCGAVARIAGLLHVVSHSGDSGNCGSSSEVSAETLSAAIQIGDCLIMHAKAAFSLMGTDARISRAQHVLGWIRNGHHEAITHRDVQQNLKGTMTSTEIVEALGVLVEHGYLRERSAPDDAARRGRKPKPTYEVSPYCHNPHKPPNEQPALAA